MSAAILDTLAVGRRQTGMRASLSKFWFYFSENRGAVIGLWVFVYVCILAILADVIAPHAPATQYRDALLTPPVADRPRLALPARYRRRRPRHALAADPRLALFAVRRLHRHHPGADPRPLAEAPAGNRHGDDPGHPRHGRVAETGQRVSVHYAGQKVEEQPVLDLFTDPHHPYTSALLAALPERAEPGDLPAIPGVVPGFFHRPKGCLFSPRCRYATERCITVQPAEASKAEGEALCHYPLIECVPRGHPAFEAVA